MSRYNHFKWFFSALVVFSCTPLLGIFPNLWRNDPLSMFSSVYPYSFLATRQKAALMRFDYSFTQPRFRCSISGHWQFADRARDHARNVINIGDINGPINLLSPFYDPKLREVLYPALKFPTADGLPPEECRPYIEDPRFVDCNQEFGFLTVPLEYRKRGVRFETELLLIDHCFHALGLEIQWGINDVRQTVCDFGDLTCQALGKACPAVSNPYTQECPIPAPSEDVPGITPPFINPVDVPPCQQTACNFLNKKDCVKAVQPFKPCCDSTICFSPPKECKAFVINNIMSQREVITDILGLDLCNYHKTGLDDLRVSLFWRHLYVINEDDDRYPRTVFMPFVQAGVGIPFMEEIKNCKLYAVPNGNNRHAFVGGRAGFTIDFLDTIDISFAGGFSYFFKKDECNVYLPTDPAQSGIFPYSADISRRPGPTWNFNFGMHAYHFLDNLSVWIEYAIVSHAQDKIDVRRSFIPQGSRYFETGFDIDRAECLTKWESHLVNVGFNYDLWSCMSIGFLWQAPVKQRNVYRSGTYLGTLTFVF